MTRDKAIHSDVSPAQTVVHLIDSFNAACRASLDRLFAQTCVFTLETETHLFETFYKDQGSTMF